MQLGQNFDTCVECRGISIYAPKHACGLDILFHSYHYQWCYLPSYFTQISFAKEGIWPIAIDLSWVTRSSYPCGTLPANPDVHEIRLIHDYTLWFQTTHCLNPWDVLTNATDTLHQEVFSPHCLLFDLSSLSLLSAVTFSSPGYINISAISV